MKKSRMMLSMVFLSLALVACSSEQQIESRGGYLGGSQGVVAVFEAFGVEEEGVYSIYDSDTFPLEVTLFNKGEYELQANDVKVKLRGPAESEVSGVASRELQNQVVVDKISELVPTGGEETISFGTEAKFLTEVSGFVDREWNAIIEYNYETEIIIPEVCLKEDLRDERVCKVREDKSFFVSGAPVSVFSVKEDTAGKGIVALKIKVRDVGGGDKVTKQGEDFTVKDTLTYALDDSAWECKSGGKVNEARLLNGEAEIVCKLKNALPEDELSTKQVKLTLKYKYRDLVKEELRIKESVE